MNDADMLMFAVASDRGVWEAAYDLLVLLGAALVLGVLAESLKQSAIVGYLIAGLLVGPNGLGLIVDDKRVESVAEFGVVLLLFSIGLEFSLGQFARMGRSVAVGGPLQIVGTILLFFFLGLIAGVPAKESGVLAAAIAMSSTACVLRLLVDRTELDSRHGRASLGILLIQDLAVVPIILLVAVLATGGDTSQTAFRLLRSIGAALLLVVALVAVFSFAAPRFMRFRVWMRNRDLPIVMALLAAGSAAAVAHAMGLSAALGAFLAGMLLAVSPFALQIRSDVRPFKTVMVTLFFASVGMFGEPRWAIAHIPEIAVTVAVIVAGKLFVIALLFSFLGEPLLVGIATGLALAQVGEFSFVLAALAHGEDNSSSLVSDHSFRLLISASIVTLLATPYLIVAAGNIDTYARKWKKKLLRRWPPLTRSRRSSALTRTTEIVVKALQGPIAAQPIGEASELIFIIGFGPAGQRSAEELLRRTRPRLVVIDWNHENRSAAERMQIEFHLGDATQADVVEESGIAQAAVVVVTLPDPKQAKLVAQLASRLAPRAAVIVRARYHLMVWEILLSGVHAVVDEEQEVGRRLAHEVRRFLRIRSVAEHWDSDVSDSTEMGP